MSDYSSRSNKKCESIEARTKHLRDCTEWGIRLELMDQDVQAVEQQGR